MNGDERVNEPMTHLARQVGRGGFFHGTCCGAQSGARTPNRDDVTCEACLDETKRTAVDPKRVMASYRAWKSRQSSEE
jgi:hypothetical protein